MTHPLWIVKHFLVKSKKKTSSYQKWAQLEQFALPYQAAKQKEERHSAFLYFNCNWTSAEKKHHSV